MPESIPFTFVFFPKPVAGSAACTGCLHQAKEIVLRISAWAPCPAAINSGKIIIKGKNFGVVEVVCVKKKYFP